MFLDWAALNPIVQALGWALIHFLWQGALVGAFFALSVRLLREAPPAIRYWLGLACLAALAAAPVITFCIVYPQVTPTGGGHTLVLGAFSATAAASAVDPAVSWPGVLERFLPWVVAAWAVGVVLHSGRVFLKWRRMRRLARVGVRTPSESLLLRAAELSELFGIRRAVTILESTLVEVPTVLGWLKPVILLPTASLVGLSPRQLELVIAHELSHVRRWDYLVNLLQVCVETALFYHPVVAWISRRVREEREKCCDDLVVDTCGNRLEYAKALTNLESIRSGDMLPALAATDGQLFERIERIVCNHAAEPRDAVAGNTLFLVIVGLTVMAAGRLADPLGAFEAQRARVGDALVNELLLATVPMHSQALLAPLENARISADADPVAVPKVEAARESPAPASVVEERRVAVSETDAPVAGAEVATARPEREVVAEQNMNKASAAIASAARALEMLAPANIEIPAPSVEQEPAPRRVTPETQRVVADRFAEPQPEVLVRVPPEYPVRARLAGQRGFVEVQFSLNADGKPVEVEIVDSRPRRVFDRAALRAIRQWRFDPTSMARSDVERVTQRFDFNLSGNAAPFVGVQDCRPLTGTRICRSDSPTALMAREATSP